MKHFARWHEIWRIAVGPLSRQMRVATWGLFIAAVLFSGVRLLMDKTLSAVVMGASVPLSFLVVFYWAIFVTGAATLNRPERAHLVPSLNSRVRRAAAWTWSLIMSPFLAIASVKANGLLLLMLVSVGVTSIGLVRAGRTQFVYVVLLAMFIYIYYLSTGDQYWSDGVLVIGCLLSLAFAVWALFAAFPHGGERHWAMQGGHAQAQALDSTEGFLAHLRGGGGRSPTYALLLKADLSSAKRRRNLWLHALGRNAHRFVFVLPCLAVAALMLLLEPGVNAISAELDMRKVIGNMCIGVLFFCFYMWCRFWYGVRSSAPEQALVRLTPGAPCAADINRKLAGAILFTCLAKWLAVLLLALGFSLLWDGRATSLQMVIAVMCAALSFAGASLGDYARHLEIGIVGQSLLTFLCFILALIAGFWMENMAVWSLLIGLILAIAVCTILHRWRAMMAAPVAFPAGRFA